MHYYKRNIGDYAKKAGRLSMLQHGSYTLLIDACYDREQFPTMEDAIEWTWASTPEEESAVAFVLRKFFTLEDGVYVQKRIQEEIAEYHAKAATNKRIADERETKRKGLDTNRSPSVNEPPPNHKPLTINQEPKKREAKASSSKAKLPTAPLQSIVDLYHEVLPELPGCRVMDKDREKAIGEFWRWVLTTTRPDGTPRATNDGEALDWTRDYMTLARKNDFIMGRGSRSPEHANWRCSIEYLLSSRGMKKVIEETKDAS